MFKKGDRVRHKDIGINNQQGILTILEIKNNSAICNCPEYSRTHLGPWTYNLSELVKVE